MMQYTKIALIPAYEPQSDLLPLLRGLSSSGFTIILVDDGSSAVARPVLIKAEAYAKVLHHDKNKGKGAALKTGYFYIERTYQKPYVVVTVDADGQHKLPDVQRVVEEAERYPGALVLGRRDFKGEIPLRSRFGNALTRGVFRLAAGRKIYDTQTGLRACTNRLVPALLTIRGDRYEYEMNQLMELSRDGTEIREVGIETVYENNNQSSHFRVIPDSLRIYGQILKFAAASITGFLVDLVSFTVLSAVGCSIALANVLARVLSATTNYTMNRALVFQDRQKVGRSLWRYLLLAISILTGNTLLLYLLVQGAGIGRIPAKILAECLCFIFSFLVQKRWVFSSACEEVQV